MDKREHYRALIQQLLSRLATVLNTHYTSHNSDVVAYCVFDTEHDHYLLLKVGWMGKRRLCGTTLYVRLQHGKFWIEDDMTEEGIATELVQSGVPKDDIVLAFHAPEERQFTDFATV